jgi:hypothetical protein
MMGTCHATQIRLCPYVDNIGVIDKGNTVAFGGTIDQKQHEVGPFRTLPGSFYADGFDLARVFANPRGIREAYFDAC